MTATAADLSLRYSISTAISGDSTINKNGLGKYLSQTVAPSTLNTVFDTITQAQNAADQVDYRCVFIANLNATDSITNLKVWLAQVSGGATAAIGLDPTGLTDMNAVAVQAVTITNDATAPASVTFSAPTSGAPFIIPTLGPRQCFAVWMRRTATGSAAVASDGADLLLEGTVV